MGWEETDGLCGVCKESARSLRGVGGFLDGVGSLEAEIVKGRGGNVFVRWWGRCVVDCGEGGSS